MKNKFKLGDCVGTNIQYMNGFDDDVFAPNGLRRLTDLVITEVYDLGEVNEKETSKYSQSFLYECKGRTETYLLNQCFLEAN